MRRALVVVALLVALVTFVGAPPAPAQSGGLRAGVGVGDITAPVGTPMFAYTAREAAASGGEPFVGQESFDTNFYAKTFVASVGVHTRVLARAVVLERGATKLALVQVDLGGMPYELHQAVVQRITATGIDRDHLLISVTHSHGSVGPIWPQTHSGYAILGGDLFDPRVFDHVADGIADAVLGADSSLAPARVGVAQVQVLDATNNRNVGPHRTNGDEAHLGREDDKPHSIDGTLTAIRVDTADGRPLGLWSSFAIHGTSFGDDMLHFTGDNQGFAERIVEDEIRRRAGLPADAVVVHALANGAEGDISPRGSPPAVGEVPLALPPESDDGLEPAAYVNGNFASAEMAGIRVARGALAAWEQAGTAMRDDVALDARFTLLPLDGQLVDGEPVGATVALGCGGVACPDGTELPVDVPGQGAKFPVASGPPGVLVPPFAPLQLLRIGDLLVGGVPFEVTKQMGTRLRVAIAGAAAAGGLGTVRIAIAGLANGYGSYLATPEEYDESFYEGSFTLYGRRQGPAVQGGLVSLVGPLATGTPAPAGFPAVEFVDPSVDEPPPLLPEPGAGTAVTQPASIRRFEKTTFVWHGGDPAADDPHVRIERRNAAGGFDLVATDDGFEDLVTHRRPTGTSPHEWNDTWETTACSPTGTHRFVVSGASGAGAYEIVSAPFEVTPAPSPTPGPVAVASRLLSFTATYPEPDDTTLRVRPRFASGGTASVLVTEPGSPARTVDAEWSDARGRYEAAGSFASATTAEIVAGSLVDGCGNGAVLAAATAPPGPAPAPASAPSAGRAPERLARTGGGAQAATVAMLVAAVVLLVSRRRPV